MKIFVKTLDDKQILPKSWKTDINKVNKFQIQRLNKFRDKNGELSQNKDVPNSSKMDITTFLRKFLVKHQRLEYEKQLMDQFDRMYINSVQDLMTLQAHSWDTIQQNNNLGPVITPLLKKDIEQLRVSSKIESKSLKNKSFGEILADMHKIKRYLLYETRTKIKNTKEGNNKVDAIEKLAFLSRDALKKGFDEQKNDQKFDGGPIMSQIQSYLEDNFATSDLSDLIKPSHGMILVI